MKKMFLLKYTFLLTKRTNFLKKFKNQSYFNSIKKKTRILQRINRMKFNAKPLMIVVLKGLFDYCRTTTHLGSISWSLLEL